MTKQRKLRDWTCNPDTGRSNSSPLFENLIDEVARLIRGDAHQLMAGNAGNTARLIMAQLAQYMGSRPEMTLGPRGQ